MVVEEPGSKLSTTSKSPLSTLKRRSFGPNKPHLLPSTLLTNANGGYSRKQRRLADIDIYIYNLGGGERPALVAFRTSEQGTVCARRTSQGGTV